MAEPKLSANTIESVERKLNEESILKKKIRDFLIFLYKKKYENFTVGRDFRLGMPLWFTNVSVKFGDYCYLGPRANISNPLAVGDLVLISSDFRVIGNDHGMFNIGVPMRIAEPEKKALMTTVIESEVWIGQGVTILSGVRIGRGAVIGANSLVNKDIEPYTIVGGVPARKIKARFTEDEVKVHQSNIYENHHVL
ncbi:hypothetical protein N9H48_06690 [Pseudoalteromonas marina]|nr:hypothetical protein [Pseudoalteromonas marina]